MKSIQIVLNKCFLAVTAAACTFAHVSDARADLVITYGDTTILPGGVGSIDVFVRSNTGTDHVQFANYTFDLFLPNTSSPGILTFQPNELQSSSEQSSNLPVPYLFLGDTSPSNFRAVVQADKPQSISGFDSTASAKDVVVGANNLLLARLELRHIGNSQSGDFTIRLRNNPGQTFFLDANGSTTPIAAASFTNSGTISVTAVPESSSLVHCSLVAGVVLLGIWKRRFQQKQILQTHSR